MTDVKELRFTKTHEWMRVENGTAIVGITDYAQQEIRDIVYIELPKIGKECAQAAAVAVIESVKAAFEIYAPVSGKVVAVNQKAIEDVSLVHQSPYEEGWLFKIEMRNRQEADGLMNFAQYNQLTAQAHH